MQTLLLVLTDISYDGLLFSKEEETTFIGVPKQMGVVKCVTMETVGY